jgi:hypothetical protein
MIFVAVQGVALLMFIEYCHAVFILSIVMLDIVMLNIVMLCALVLNVLKSLMFCAKWLKAMCYYTECRGTNYLGY